MHIITCLEDIALLRKNINTDKALLDIIESDFMYMIKEFRKLGTKFVLGQSGSYIIFSSSDNLNILFNYGIKDISEVIPEFVESIQINKTLYIRVLIISDKGYCILLYSNAQYIDNAYKIWRKKCNT